MLTAVRTYLRARPFASVQDLALHLQVSPEVARDLCQRWISKGRIERVDCSPGCANCQLCQGTATELYRWCD